MKAELIDKKLDNGQICVKVRYTDDETGVAIVEDYSVRGVPSETWLEDMIADRIAKLTITDQDKTYYDTLTLGEITIPNDEA